MVGLNSSETLGPRHSKAHPSEWAYNRVSTVPLSTIFETTLFSWQIGTVHIEF